MISKVLEKAKKSLGWLITFVNNNGWGSPNLRLVLFDIYVRSILQFGVNVWGPRLLRGGMEHAYIQPMLVQQRRAMRVLLGLPKRLHNCLVYAICARPPLKAALNKQIYRYHRRIQEI